MQMLSTEKLSKHVTMEAMGVKAPSFFKLMILKGPSTNQTRHLSKRSAAITC